MAAANGFVTVRPDTVYDATTAVAAAGYTFIQQFTAPSAGTLELSEIGLWGFDNGDVFRMAVFEDDSANGCPGAVVANSDIELTMNTDSSGAIQYGTYGTKPVVTGGTVYWIGMLDNLAVTVHRKDAGGTALYKSGLTYPTWPDGDAWHTHTDSARDFSFYAVYEASSTGQSPAYAYAQQ